MAPCLRARYGEDDGILQAGQSACPATQVVRRVADGSVDFSVTGGD